MTNEELCYLAKKGDRQAMAQLIADNEGMIRRRAWMFMAGNKTSCQNFSILLEDLEQEGRIAILKAVDTYDAGREVKFLTYAEKIMQNRMMDWLRQEMSEKQSKNGFLHRSFNDMMDIAESVQDSRGFVGVDDLPVAITEAELHKMVNYYRQPEEVFFWLESMKELYHAMSQLTERQHAVIYYRYGFEDGRYHEPKETGEHFDTDVKTIRTAERKALSSMRKEMTGTKKGKTKK